MVTAETAEVYRLFGQRQARGESACFEQWAHAVSEDDDLLGLIDTLPSDKRQPNLVFAAARWVGIEPGPVAPFRTGLLRAWPQVREVVLARHTQTNEAGRCAVLLPLLAALPQPVALLEVGASAGLCLYPDRYSYQYGELPQLDPASGPAPVVCPCAVSGPVPVPARLPQVVWRAGIDLHPLDVSDPDQMRWLEALVWPEQEIRRQRLRAAIRIARTDPPHLVSGELTESVESLAREAPPDATLVIFHSAVLAYLDVAARAQFVSAVKTLPGHWISNEGPLVVPSPEQPEHPLPPSPDPTKALLVLALDGQPLAYAGDHGDCLHWFG